jgi:hypothetical protein
VGGCGWEVGREGEKAKVSSVHDTVALAMWMSGMPGVCVCLCARASLSRSLSLSFCMRMCMCLGVYTCVPACILKGVKCECTWTNVRACVRACVRDCVHMCALSTSNCRFVAESHECTRRCAHPEGCAEKGVYICYVANGRGGGDLVKYCKHHRITSSHAAAFIAQASSVSMACQHPQVFIFCAPPFSLPALLRVVSR